MKPLWPASLVERVLLVIFALGVAAYAVVAFVRRQRGMWDPSGADGDMFQAVWQYWRYSIPGAFKPGDLLTDYAFVMHAPPAWWAMMASLSEVTTPLVAAKLLNVAGYVLVCVTMFVAVGKRSHPFLGLCGVLLLVRDVGTTDLIIGGYARTFGPALALAFLGAFMLERHRTALVILVVQAALYPSVVLACGLAYGPYTLLRGPTMHRRLVRIAGMTIAGVLILGLGEFQALASPRWWGPVVTRAEADAMPAWHVGGRLPALPERPVQRELELRANFAFHSEHDAPLASVATKLGRMHYIPIHLLLVGMGLFGALMARARRRRGEQAVGFPWQIPALLAAGAAAFALATVFAFRLYIPYRPLAYTWPFIVEAAIPLAFYATFSLLRRRALGLALAVVLSVVPVFLIFGAGLDDKPTRFPTSEGQRPLLDWIAKQPRDAMFAGDLRFMHSIPLLAQHRVFVNTDLAHPFRKGYYNECARRMRRMFDMLYATKLEDVVSIAHTEHIDYIVFSSKSHDAPDGWLFQPLRDEIGRVFRKNQHNFALRALPRSAIAYKAHGLIVVNVGKLAKALAAGETAPVPFIGPRDAPALGPEPAPKKH